jgi:hypothetical protein
MKVRGFIRLVALGAAPMLALGSGLGTVPVGANDGTGCQLQSARGDIHHVINIVFDNTHFTRDNPNVPSDLEQMPNLLNFITNNGTLVSKHHTPLISHTATDILTSLTGVYGDRMGQPVSNSFRYFTPTGTTRTGVSFAYWTAPLFDVSGPGQTNFTPEMINEKGKIAPAPWAPFTRAGCDFGAVATANTVLENTAIDIPTVFGAGSPEAAEAAASAAAPPGTAARALAQTDFVGLGVHCAQGSTLCSAANNGRPDLLPDEPGGYSGFSGLFGAKYVDPAINFSPPTDLDGNPITDPFGQPGFPGFDGVLATVTLSYVARMQEAGVPVTYAYISDAHDGHGKAGNIHFAYGPGEAGYVQQLKDYDRAFGQFFDRLAAHGINKSNTLFVFTADEGDHFAGDVPTPAGCDGVTTPCTYNRVGEINGNLRGLIATTFGDTTPFSVHADMAPTVYVTGNPPRSDPAVRALERESGQLTVTSPYTGNLDQVAVALADPVEEQALHLVTADPSRTPTFTLFADPNYFLFAAAPNCLSPCVTIPPRSNNSFAWNHGGIQREIMTTWLGMVGPGVLPAGVMDDLWSDHADIRPTVLSLLGLKDDYAHQGRVLVEALAGWAVPVSLNASRDTFIPLGQVYKQINAPVGKLGLQTLRISTQALAGGSAQSDAAYEQIESQLQSITTTRDALAAQIEAVLEAAEFQGQPLNEQQAQELIAQAYSLLGRVSDLANGP